MKTTTPDPDFAPETSPRRLTDVQSVCVSCVTIFTLAVAAFLVVCGIIAYGSLEAIRLQPSIGKEVGMFALPAVAFGGIAIGIITAISGITLYSTSEIVQK